MTIKFEFLVCLCAKNAYARNLILPASWLALTNYDTHDMQDWTWTKIWTLLSGIRKRIYLDVQSFFSSSTHFNVFSHSPLMNSALSEGCTPSFCSSQYATDVLACLRVTIDTGVGKRKR